MDYDDEFSFSAEDFAAMDAAVEAASRERTRMDAAGSVLGITALHGWQRSVIQAWRAGRDSLVLSGTGSGKSLCYMLPAVLCADEGAVTLVVTPLISLARDQVHRLHVCGVPRFFFFCSANQLASVSTKCFHFNPKFVQRLPHSARG